jgi:hypothetical protein
VLDDGPWWREAAADHTVGWFYFRNDPLVAKTAGVLLKDEGRRMAVKLREAAGAAGEAGRRRLNRRASPSHDPRNLGRGLLLLAIVGQTVRR